MTKWAEVTFVETKTILVEVEDNEDAIADAIEVASDNVECSINSLRKFYFERFVEPDELRRIKTYAEEVMDL